MASTISANSAGGGGLVTTGDASGVLDLQTAGVTALTIDASQQVTFANSLTSPTLVTPVLGTPSSGNLSSCTGSNLAKAWVNFVGSSGAVNASFNVSSVTRTGAGLYTLNFTAGLADANYCVTANGTWDSSAPNNIPLFGTYQGASRTTTTCQVSCNNSSSQARFDGAFLFVAIFR